MTVSTVRMYWSAARRHPLVSGGLLLVLAGVMHLAQRHEEGPKALAYLAAMLGGAFLVDLFTLRFPATHGLPVRRPRHETLWVLGIELAALLTLALQYMVLDWANLSFAARLALLPTVVVISPSSSRWCCGSRGIARASSVSGGTRRVGSSFPCCS